MLVLLLALVSKPVAAAVPVEGSCKVQGWRFCRTGQSVEASEAAVQLGTVVDAEQLGVGSLTSAEIAVAVAVAEHKDSFASEAFAVRRFAAVDLHTGAVASNQSLTAFAVAAEVLVGSFAEDNRK